MRCKKVIHAVGPRWKGGSKNEENDLFDAVYLSLTEASNYKLVSVALPPISAGIYGYPLGQCVSIIIEAINQFILESTNTSLRNIYLVSIKRNEVEALSNALKTRYGDKAKMVEQKSKGLLDNSDLYKGEYTNTLNQLTHFNILLHVLNMIAFFNK